MANKSAIEWTEATWNPIVGCSIVSPGCTNCYAMKMAARIQKMNRTGGSGSNYVNHYDGTTKVVNGNPVWTGEVHFAGDKIFEAPLHRKKPTTYFVNSMGDLFHEAIDDATILRVLDIIRRTSHDGGSNCGKIANGAGEHTYQLLTKRAARMSVFMRRLRFDSNTGLYLSDDSKCPVILKNLWLGVSAERQPEWDERTRYLRQTPAVVRFVSVEPLLGAIDGREALTELDWVIVGGESGPHARPMHPDWAREFRDQCAWRDVPFFFKQWGEWLPWQDFTIADIEDDAEQTRFLTEEWCDDHWTRIGYPMWCDSIDGNIDDEHCVGRVGKKAAGRLLDGKLHDAMPSNRSAITEQV